MDHKQPANIDEYLTTFPADVRSTLEKVRQTIHKAAPEATETVSYGIPCFNVNGKYVVYFAGWTHHISVYPVPEGDDDLQQAMLSYQSGKGTLKFPLDQPIPYDLIKKVTVALVARSRNS